VNNTKPPLLARIRYVLARSRHAAIIPVVLLAKILTIVIRLFSGAFFCFIAIAPGWIIIRIVAGAFAHPHDIDLVSVIVLGVCLLLLYFFLLLAYRAITGKGRKTDGRLLPSWAMKAFVASYGAIGILTVILGIRAGAWREIVAGFLILAQAMS
jgi:hypothetical protein